MDRLEAVGDPGLREALLFARGQDRAVTADDLAEAREVHRNVARSRLERLVGAGLLESGYERRSGRVGPGAGRPAKTYSVAPELESIEFPVRRYETLLGLLVDAVTADERRDRIHDVGVSFGHVLAERARLRPAKTLRTGFERLCAAVRSLGFQVSLEHVGREGAVISTPNCPLRPLVRERPDTAALDRGMWVGLASRALDRREVRDVVCTTGDCLSDRAPCRVVVNLVAPSLR